MPICPRGHESQAEDWCDFCGFPMTPPPGLAVPGSAAPFGSGHTPAPGAGVPPTAPPPFGHPDDPYGAGGPHHTQPGQPDPYAARPVQPVQPVQPPGPQGQPHQHHYQQQVQQQSHHQAAGHHQTQQPQSGAPYPPHQQSQQPDPYAQPPGGAGQFAPPTGPPQARQVQQAGHAAHAPQAGELTTDLATCPICRTPQTGRYCEECGFDYALSNPEAQHPGAGGRHPGFPPPAPGPYQPPVPAPAPTPDPYRPPVPPPAPAPEPSPFPPVGAQGVPAAPTAPGMPGAPGAPAPFGAGDPFRKPGPYPEQGGAEGLQSFDSGPTYARPGTAPGDEFGTSFHLQPPAQQQPPAAPVRSTWIAVVSADRDYFTDMMARSGPEAAGLFFPPYCPERRIPLTGRGQLRIGRRSAHRGTVPEIDLSVPPEDPGASHQHAMLAEQADGSWVLVDQDSTNGTTVNNGAEPVPPHTAIPLNDGDRVHIGAWTTITLHRS